MRATSNSIFTSLFLHWGLKSRDSRQSALPASWRYWPVFLCMMALCAGAWGQATTSIRGAVTDPSGGAIVGATVTLVNTDSKIEREAISGSDGGYQFLLLPPGTYTLAVTATGFQRFEKTGLVLLVNTPATLNMALKVGSATEVVRVSTEPPALNLVDASIGNSFDEKQVSQIPLEGRNVPDLLSLQAGVAYTGNRPDIDKDQDTRNGAVNGARSDQSNITLDGVDVNDQANGYAFTSVLPVTQDSVEEFRVTTSNYGADQGTGSGAQVALVTKSGTNTFHGSLYENLRNTATSANDYLVKQAELNTGSSNKPLRLNRNIFGASVGGPFMKDRLFFFANYEGTRRREEEGAERVIPTPSMCQGNLKYLYQDPSNPNGPLLTQTLTPTDLANLDPRSRPGFFLPGTPTGIDPAMLDLSNPAAPGGYLGRTFCTGKTVTNDISAGDGLNYAGFLFRAPTSLNNDAFIARLDYRLSPKHTLFWRGAVQNLKNPGAPFLPGDAPEQTVADHSKGFVLGYTAVITPTLANSFRWGFTRQSFGVDGNSDIPWNQFLGLDEGFNYSHNFQVPIHNLVDDLSWTKKSHALQFGAAIGLARDPRTSFLHSNNLALGTTNWTSPIGFAGTSSPLDPLNSTWHPAFNPTIAASGFLPGTAPEPLTATQYDRPLLALYGMISDVVANYNLDRNGNVMGPLAGGLGAPVKRRYGLNSYEFYGQDAWRIKPNLTLTYGLRWSLFPPPWEVNGLQTSPTFGLGTQFAQNVKNMQQGLGYTSELPIAFALGGPANHGKGLYPFEKTDFSPRVAIAYSPRVHGGLLKNLFGEENQTVIRAGFARVYDRAGFALLNSFDQIGSAGLTTTLQNPCCTFNQTGAEDLPRITGIHDIPMVNTPPNNPPNAIAPTQFLQPAPLPGFPQVPGVFSQANLWATDDTLKTPHAYAIDFSVGRELPKRFSLQVSYVGRFGRRLLTQRDLSQPLDIVDPKTGIDYYSAAAALSNLARQFAAANLACGRGGTANFYQAVITTPASPPMPTAACPQPNPQPDVLKVNAASLGRTYQYWVDMLPALRCSNCQYADPFTGFIPTTTNTTDGLLQSVFDLYYNPLLSVIGDEIVGLADIDSYGGLGDTSGSGIPYFFNGRNSMLPGLCPGSFCQSGKFLSNQAFSAYGWSSIGTSNYNALQASLRKQFSHGVQFDFNYTYSKSLDITSAASRVGFAVYGYTNIGLVGSRLVNPFKPNLAHAPSDFDLRHQMNFNWIADLPFGKGQPFGSNSNGFVNALFGGWQLSGLARWTSGFPFSVDGGQRWPTDWFLTAIAQQTSRQKTGTYHLVDPSSGYSFVSPFPNPASAQAAFTLPLPGDVGSRNVLRGNGYASLDMSLGKRWKMPYREAHNIQFLWQVFNVPNLTRFNAQGVGSSLVTSLTQQPTHFGAYTSQLTSARVMQFSLRYEF